MTEQSTEDNATSFSATLDRLKDSYLLEQHRIDSYLHWPFGDSSTCSKKKMSQAGFFWSGSKREPDTATCFVCNKTLDGWEATDDPWKEHAKHAPQCMFVKHARPESELTVQEFLEIFRIVLKNKMLRSLEKAKAELNAECSKKMEEYLGKKPDKK